MKASSIIAAALMTLAAAAHSSELRKEGPASSPFNVMPFELPAELADKARDYRNGWPRLTGFEFSGLHWGQFVVIYANQGVEIYKNNYLAYLAAYMDEDDDDEESTAAEEFTPYKTGTVFLKENYLSGDGQPGKPLSLTFMIKREPGFDTDNGDWEYIQSTVDGKIILRGKADDPAVHAPCGDCHKNMAERDYVFSTYYSEPK